MSVRLRSFAALLACALVLLLGARGALAGRVAPGVAQTSGVAVTVHDRAYVATQWTAADGLSVNSIYDLHRGPQGYLWIATHDGLVRFDGTRFEVFDTSTTPAFSSNRFVQVEGAADGTLWMVLQGGDVVRYAEGRFTRDAAAFGLPPETLTHVVRAQAEGVWLSTDAGLWHYDAKAGRFAAVAPAHVTARVFALDRAADGTLWLGLRGEVVAVRPDAAASGAAASGAAAWAEVARLTAADGLQARVPVTLVEATAPGMLWIGSGGFAQYRFRPDAPAAGTLDRTTNTGARLPLANRLPASVEAPHMEGEPLLVAPRPGGGTLLGTYGQAAEVRGDGSVAVRRLADGPTRWAVPDTARGGRWWHRGGRVYYDTTHVATVDGTIETAVLAGSSLWIGTQTRGLVRLAPATFATLSAGDGLAGRYVYGLSLGPDGALWAATTAGLSRVDAAAPRPRVAQTQAFDSRLYRKTRSVLHDRDGHLWVGTLRGLCRVEAGACRPVPFPDPKPRREVESIHRDRHGALWVGTHDGLLRGRVRADGSVRWTADLGAAHGLPHPDVQRLVEAPDGALWIATDGGGVARLAPERLPAEAAFLRFDALTPDDDGLPTGHVRELFFDPDAAAPEGASGQAAAPRTVWLGTEGRGLVRLTLAYGTAREGRATGDTLRVAAQAVIGKADGLPGNSVHRLLPDDDGRWWMSTNEGIFWVRRDDLARFADGRDLAIRPYVHTTAYTERDGLRLREANGGVQTAGLRAPDGRLWFPTQDGLAVVDPARVPVTRPAPQPFVVGARLGLTPIPFASGDGGDTSLRLTPAQRTFALDFTAPDLSDPASPRFRYRLRGFETAWQQGDAARTAFYTQVPPGRYTFEVAVGRGTGAVRTASLPVHVVPTLWETRWMRAVLALAVLAVCAGALRHYRRAGQRREAELAHLVEDRTAELVQAKERAEQLGMAKTAFLASMSHEIRTPLTSIVGFSEVLLEEAEGPLRQHAELVHRSSHRLRATLTSILDLARLEAGKTSIDLRPVNLAREAAEVVEEMRPRAEAKGLTLRLDPAPPPPCWVYADRIHLSRVLLNLITNAIKYTDAGSVTVRIVNPVDLADAPFVAVCDTGIGMHPASQAAVFEPFVRERRRTVSARDGTGLGLAITKQLVNLMGGRITLASVVDEGSTFTVYLRRPFPEGAAPAPAVEDVPGGAGSEPSTAAEAPTAGAPVEGASPAPAEDAARSPLAAGKAPRGAPSAGGPGTGGPGAL